MFEERELVDGAVVVVVELATCETLACDHAGSLLWQDHYFSTRMRMAPNTFLICFNNRLLPTMPVLLYPIQTS